MTGGPLQAKLLVAELLETAVCCVCVCVQNSLAEVIDNMSERILPGIHLYHSNTSDDFVHDPHSFVRDLSRFQPLGVCVWVWVWVCVYVGQEHEELQ